MAPLGTIHTYPGPSRASKALAAAKLGGVEVNITPEFKPGVSNKTPEYLAKFPLGKMPAFESASGDFFLSESTAIAEYVASKGSARVQLLGRDDEETALIRQWVCFADGHLEGAIGPLARWRLGVGECDAKQEEECAKDLKRWLGYMESHLKKGNGGWLAGSEEKGPSMADLVTGMVIGFGLMAYLDKELRDEYPEVMAWHARLVGYPGLEEFYKVDMVEVRKAVPA